MPSVPDSTTSTTSSSTTTDSYTVTAPLSKEGSTISTPSGTVQVRPYRSSSSSQLKALITFTPRTSRLDRDDRVPGDRSDEFRGFYSLFWIVLFLLFCRTSLQSWEDNRTFLSGTFGRLITGDALVLAISDFVLVMSTIVCVPFVKALRDGRFRYYWVGVLIQHVWQTLFLGVAVWWGFHRQWYWVQSGFLVLHALSTLMKMHSYCAHNGMLADVYYRLQSEAEQLKQFLDSKPDRGATIYAEASKVKKDRLQEMEDMKAEALRKEKKENEGVEIPVGTPTVGEGSTIIGNGNISSTTGFSDALRFRLSATNGQLKGSLNTPAIPSPLANSATSSKGSTPPPGNTDPQRSPVPLGTSLEPSHSTTSQQPREPHVLTYSSNEHVATLAKNIDLMKDELRSNGPNGVVWPSNISYYRFADFMLVPTLVYQLEYPRTTTMRPLYVLEKVFATFGVFSLIYVITEHYIMPLIPKPGDSLIKTYVNLCIPMIVNYLLIFYIIFECVCNGFAELTYFADREFYQDWWNSTTWDQFSRKWNKPVHTFLLRHVYASTMSTYQLSRMTATFWTFLLSSLCHELVMAVVTKKIRMYLFLMQMAQLPMIALGKLPAVKRNKTMGNIVFWMGLMSGFPLLAIAYLLY